MENLGGHQEGGTLPQAATCLLCRKLGAFPIKVLHISASIQPLSLSERRKRKTTVMITATIATSGPKTKAPVVAASIDLSGALEAKVSINSRPQLPNSDSR